MPKSRVRPGARAQLLKRRARAQKRRERADYRTTLAASIINRAIALGYDDLAADVAFAAIARGRKQR